MSFGIRNRDGGGFRCSCDWWWGSYAESSVDFGVLSLLCIESGKFLVFLFFVFLFFSLEFGFILLCKISDNRNKEKTGTGNEVWRTLRW